MKTHLCRALAAALFSAASVTAVQAATVDVTISNNNDPGGLYFTPFLTVFHDGSYVPFVAETPTQMGQAASAGVEEIAELGGTGIETAFVQANFATAIVETLVEPAGFGSVPGQPPVFDPGNAATLRVDLDPTENRYLTILSMAIPSNDTFISATFDLFSGSDPIYTTHVLDFTSLYDAGTEANRQDGFGQAFNLSPLNSSPAGFEGDPEDVNPVVHSPNLNELATLFGQAIPPLGPNTTNDLASFTPANLVSVEIAPVPLPAAAPMLLVGLGGLAFAARRKRR